MGNSPVHTHLLHMVLAAKRNFAAVAALVAVVASIVAVEARVAVTGLAAVADEVEQSAVVYFDFDLAAAMLVDGPASDMEGSAMRR